MTVRSAAPPIRAIRTFAISATTWGAALCLCLSAWAPAAAASGNTGSGSGGTGQAAATPQGATGASAPTSQADLQVKAQELAGQIEANGRTLDELSASYNAAQIRLQSLNVQLDSLKQGMSHETALIAQARHLLKEQAILAYLSGGAPLIYLPDRPGQDPSLSIAYAQIIAGGQQRAAQTYRTELDAMTREETAVRATEAQATLAVTAIRRDQSQASATLDAQKQALSQVKGQMAVLVAQVESAQQQAQAPAAQTATVGLTAPQSSPIQPQQSATTPSRPVPAPADVPADVVPAVQAPQPAPTAATAPPTTRRYVTTTSAPPQAAPAPAPGGSTGSVSPGVPAQAPGAGAVLAYTRAQLGKPYQWAGAGPDSFDCSGLVMMAWAQAGIHFPHLAQDQYDMTARIPLSDAQPGDLIFFGTPDNVYHVGIYIGGGQMIDAPETGQDVSVSSIYWSSLLGAGRVHT